VLRKSCLGLLDKHLGAVLDVPPISFEVALDDWLSVGPDQLRDVSFNGVVENYRLTPKQRPPCRFRTACEPRHCAVQVLISSAVNFIASSALKGLKAR
jgi:hypothetical protein